MKSKLLFALLIIGLSLPLSARERRFVCEKMFNSMTDKETVFKPGAQWMPFPPYEDRAAWDKLSAGYKSQIIKRGEQALKYEWKVIKASEFLDCKKDGDRRHLAIDRQTKSSIAALALAEAVEGKGRFIPHLIDGMYYEAERATWQYAVHTSKQPSGKALPDPSERYITNGAAHTGGIMAVAWYLMHKEFDKIDPSISKTILKAIDVNILEPFLDDSKDGTGSHFWMGKDWEKNGGQIANWTTHCTTYITYCFLLCEQDQARLNAGLKKSMRMMDNYLDSMPLDGSCDEGPSYWGMGPARMFQYADIMKYASGGKFNILDDPQVRRLCEYKSRIYIADGWEVNYSDGEPRSGCNPLLPFHMGQSLGSKEMTDFSLYLLSKGRKSSFLNPSPNMDNPMSTLFFLADYPALKAAEKQALEDAGGDFDKMREGFRSYVGSEWYPDNQVAILRGNDGWFLSAKGGTNGERHNHNDVGSAIIFLGDCPIAVDMGCSTYRKETFGTGRYTLLENISSGHNTVTINGFNQGTGKEFAARNTQCDLKNGTMTTDIAKAYPAEACCKKWVRKFILDKDGVTITDNYELSKRIASDDIHFITNAKAEISGKFVRLECHSYKDKSTAKVKISIPSGLTAVIEPIENLDKRHVKNFGPQMSRIVFKSSEKAPLKGSYSVRITAQ